MRGFTTPSCHHLRPSPAHVSSHYASCLVSLLSPLHIRPPLAQGPQDPHAKPWHLPTSSWLFFLASTGPSTRSADQHLSWGPDPMDKYLVTSYLRPLGQWLCLCPWASGLFLPLVTLPWPGPGQGPNPLAKDTYSWMTCTFLHGPVIHFVPQDRPGGRKVHSNSGALERALRGEWTGRQGAGTETGTLG